MLAPALAPFLQQVGAVPVAVLLAEPVLADLAHRQHHMRVRLGHAVGADIPMHIEIGDHAAIDELVAHEVAGQLDALLLGHLARDRELDLARKLRVDPLLGRLDLVPQLFAVGEMLGRAVRQHHFGMDDARLVREVVVPVEPLVVQPRRRAIGGGRQRARSGSARDDLGREMVDRHDGNPSTPKQATSARRISAPSQRFHQSRDRSVPRHFNDIYA